MSANSRLKALRTLVRVRERQGEVLAQAAQAAREQLSQAHEALEAANAQVRECEDAQAAGAGELDALTSAPFTTDALRALGFRLEDLKAAVVKAVQGVKNAQETVTRQEQAVAQACAAVRRNDQRLEGLRDQIDKVLQERLEHEEEQAEEESEEASTARFVARVRAARALQAETGHG